MRCVSCRLLRVEANQRPQEKGRKLGKRLEEGKRSAYALTSWGFESLRGRDAPACWMHASICLDTLCPLASTTLCAQEGHPLSLAPVPTGLHLASSWAHPGRQGRKIRGREGKRPEYSFCWVGGRLWLRPLCTARPRRRGLPCKHFILCKCSLPCLLGQGAWPPPAAAGPALGASSSRVGPPNPSPPQPVPVSPSEGLVRPDGYCALNVFDLVFPMEVGRASGRYRYMFNLLLLNGWSLPVFFFHLCAMIMRVGQIPRMCEGMPTSAYFQEILDRALEGGPAPGR